MNTFWESIVAFFKNLGHTIIGDIIAALPEAKQILLDALTALIDAAIAYVEAKYGGQYTPEMLTAMSPQEKVFFDNQRRSDALQYIKDEMAKDPSKYKPTSDSLIYFGIEARYQLKLTNSEGNHGNFPGGNSGPQN